MGSSNYAFTQGQFGPQYQQALQGQQQLASQLQQNAAGLGPNPAQHMLQQATDKNIQQNAALIGSQRGLNAGTAQRLAAQNAAGMSQQAAGQGALMGAQQQLAAQGQLGGLYNQMGGQALQGMGMQNQIDAQIAQQNAQAQAKLYGGLLSGAAALGSAGLMGGAAAAPMAAGAAGGGGQSYFQPGGGFSSVYGMAMGGEVGPQSHVSQHFMGINMQSGGSVPGQAKMSGDSPKNDTVHAMLSPGEIVIPRSITQGKDAADKASKFVAAVLSKSKGLKRG